MIQTWIRRGKRIPRLTAEGIRRMKRMQTIGACWLNKAKEATESSAVLKTEMGCNDRVPRRVSSRIRRWLDLAERPEIFGQQFARYLHIAPHASLRSDNAPDTAELQHLSQSNRSLYQRPVPNVANELQDVIDSVVVHMSPGRALRKQS
jgi:hypothetical protein